MDTLRRGLSNEAFAAARADDAAKRKAKRFNAKRVFKGSKYPGRQIVTDPSTINDIVYDNWVREQNDTKARPFQCERPYVQAAIGLPDAVGAMSRYWKGENAGKVFTEVTSRCRQCDACLAHRRRLWSARASDELKAAHRTWFATLTISPENRFMATLQASASAESAGHGQWRAMDASNQFRYLVKHINQDIDRYFKRVRKHGSLRYLLVSEAHKDGFPHFHALIHEAGLPLTKRLLESNWRLGFSQFRLVNSADPRSAFYVCKYLSKDARTRVRASRQYGRAQLVSAATDAITELLRTRPAKAGSPPPVPGSP